MPMENSQMTKAEAVEKLMTGEFIPIENIFYRSPSSAKRYYEAYLKFSTRGGSSLDLHKEKLGKPIGSFRGSEYVNHLWVGKGWIVAVSRRGVELSVPSKSSSQHAWSEWRGYLSLLGMYDGMLSNKKTVIHSNADERVEDGPSK